MATKVITKYRTRAPAKKRSRRKNNLIFPLAIVAPMAYVGAGTVSNISKIGLSSSMAVLTNQMTGYDPRTNDWKLSRLKNGLGPILVGALIHKVASKFGLNRALSRSGVPFIRI